MANKVQVFSIQNDFNGGVECSRLHVDLDNSAITTKVLGVSVNAPEVGQVLVEFETDITAAEKTTLDGVVEIHAEHRLEELKRQAYAEIDTKVESRIREGFDHTIGSPPMTKRFSLSVNAQLKWTGLLVSKDMIPYPFRVPTRDDDDHHDIQDANEVLAVWSEAIATVRQYIATGTTAKEQIKAATSKSEIDTIVADFLV